MQVFHKWDEVESRYQGGSVVVGNFDGVHLGHQSLLRQTVDQAKAIGIPTVVLTFFPHPVEVLNPGKRLQRITTTQEKLARFEELGIDAVLVAPFSSDFSQISAESFVQDYLVKWLRPQQLHVGEDFRFGNNREGSRDWLATHANRFGFSLWASKLVEANGERVSSTAIRAAIAAGDMESAAQALGRPYCVGGQVEHGDHRGRELGFPTANLSYPDDKVLPKNGVYLTQVVWQRSVFPSVTNVGVRPTVSGVGRPRIEVHLIDFSQRLYDEFLAVKFLGRIREEMKFSSVEALKKQIEADVQRARSLFQSMGKQ